MGIKYNKVIDCFHVYLCTYIVTIFVSYYTNTQVPKEDNNTITHLVVHMAGHNLQQNKGN